jgi:hypothetical protein
LIVGILAFTLAFERKFFRKFFSGIASPPGPLHAKSIRAKRNCANRSSLSGKRFDATEDRD